MLVVLNPCAPLFSMATTLGKPQDVLQPSDKSGDLKALSLAIGATLWWNTFRPRSRGGLIGLTA